MRSFIQILIAFSIIMLLSCDKESNDIDFCNSCDLKTDALEIVENKDGWIAYDNEFHVFIILIGSYNDQYCYYPCEYPEYFQPEEDLSVRFSGLVNEDPLILREEPKAVYKCIRLDTIYLDNI